MNENEINKTVIRLVDRASLATPKDQYEILFHAMESVIADEQDEMLLALIAVHLWELSELALKKSGKPVMPDKLVN